VAPTIAPDGTQSDVVPAVSWRGDGAGYIDDHGVVHADTSNGATVVRDGAAIIIGSQCLPPPGGNRGDRGDQEVPDGTMFVVIAR
jgi:hypothetical protein